MISRNKGANQWEPYRSVKYRGIAVAIAAATSI
jgi:hypothetical protein